MAETKTLDVTVLNTNKLLFSKKAKSVSSTNEKGRFDILPNHQDFISLINDFIEIRDLSAQKTLFKIKTAVLYLKDNRLIIFIGIDDL